MLKIKMKHSVNHVSDARTLIQKSRKLVTCLFAASLISAALVGCGGAGGDSTGTLNGVAAEGKAIASAAVTLKDAAGTTRSATTGATGNFSFPLSGLVAPMMLKVSGAGGNYYTLVTSDDTAKRVNLSNFTHNIALMALSAADTAALDAKFANGSFNSLSSAALTAADVAFGALLSSELGTIAGVTDTSPRFIVFTPASAGQDGDEIDRLLTLFKPQLVAGSFFPFNLPPEFVRDISSASYDGTTDDLLTAGLGKTGLGSATAPAYVDANNPTAAQLRRNTIHGNYRAIIDPAPNSGYGTLYGPNVDKNNVAGAGEGKIAGKEYLAYLDNGTGSKNVTLMVQIPSTFDTANPCIVTGTSSGSRGVYGAMGSSGEWGLKNGCAVAYADKGSGIGTYTFDDDSVNLRNGIRATRTAAGTNAIFAPALDAAARTSFAASFPDRIAFKHAHSQQNPEKDWGKDTLAAVAFGFYALNQEYGVTVPGLALKRRTLNPKNTLVIASSVSNGGGSALLAAERDKLGLIDGVAVSEPQIQPNKSTGYTVQQNGTAVGEQGRSLYDYGSYAALYQPCIAGNVNRCTSLVEKGLLAGADLATQQADAKAKLRAYGWTADTEAMQTALAAAFGGVLAGFNSNTNIVVAATYANAYGRFSVTDNVCGFSFGKTAGGNIAALTAAEKAQMFATQNGIFYNPIYENSVGGAKEYSFGVSPSTNRADQSLDGMLCLRSLATGVDTVTGAALTGTLLAQSQRVRAGIAEVQATGNLRGKPAVIVTGRSDNLVPPNHASRAYLGLNAAAEGASSKLRYVEVTNANHFDVLASIIPATIVPLHVYLFRALDAVHANLKSGVALPGNQVVRTTTRADATTAITNTNVPAIAAAPAAGDAISVTGTTVNVPD